MTAAPNWQQVVEQYARNGRQEHDAVVAAHQQATDLTENPDYWEAVYTLARQAVAMSGTREEEAR